MDLNELIKNPEQIKNLIDVLQALLPKEESSNAIIVPSAPKNHTKNKIKTRGGQNRRNIDNDSENKFERMSEFNMHKEDREVDKALSKMPPVARVREEVEPIEVTCRICGKKEIISPSLIFDSISRYKCNNCATQAG